MSGKATADVESSGVDKKSGNCRGENLIRETFIVICTLWHCLSASDFDGAFFRTVRHVFVLLSLLYFIIMLLYHNYMHDVLQKFKGSRSQKVLLSFSVIILITIHCHRK